MKYTKYRIVKEYGYYYIEVPFFFWTKLYGYNLKNYYMSLKFNSYEDARSYAEDHKFQILK